MSYLPLKDGVTSQNTLWSSTQITSYIETIITNRGLSNVSGLSDSDDSILVTTKTSELTGGKTQVPYFDTSGGGFTLLEGFEILQSESPKSNFTDETLLSATRIQDLVNNATNNITTTLSGLSDTNFTSLSQNQFIRYDGSNWVNTTLATSDINDLVSDILSTDPPITGDTTIGLDESALVTDIEGAGLSANTSNDTINVGEGTGITVSDDTVNLDTGNDRNIDHSTIQISGGDGLSGGSDLTSNVELGIATDGVTNAKIAADAVQSTQIKDGAVTTDKIDGNAVGTNEIAGDAVTSTQLDTSDTYNFSAKVTTDLSAPFDTNEFVPKSYVDGIKQGLDFKDSVDVAPTDNIDLNNNSLSTVDGVDVSDITDGRILLTRQDNQIENGIYQGDLSNPDSWVRADDANEDSEVTPGLYVFVEDGAQNGRRSFVLINTTNPTLGNDELNFAPFGQAGDFSAGNNIQINGQEISVVNTTSSGSGQILDFGSSHNGSDSDSLIAYDTSAGLSYEPGLSVTDATNNNIGVTFNDGNDDYITASATGVTDNNEIFLDVSLNKQTLLGDITGSGLTENGEVISVGEGSGITVNTDSVELDTGDDRNIDHSNVTISGGDGLSGGSDITSDVTLDVATDGIQTREIDQSIEPTWTGFHTFDVGLYAHAFRAGVKTKAGPSVTVSPNEDYVVLVETSDDDATVQLPAVANLEGGEFFVIKKISANNEMEITPNEGDVGSVTIDNRASYVTRGEGLPSIKLVYSEGAGFFII